MLTNEAGFEFQFPPDAKPPFRFEIGGHNVFLHMEVLLRYLHPAERYVNDRVPLKANEDVAAVQFLFNELRSVPVGTGTHINGGAPP